MSEKLASTAYWMGSHQVSPAATHGPAYHIIVCHPGCLSWPAVPAWILRPQVVCDGSGLGAAWNLAWVDVTNATTAAHAKFEFNGWFDDKAGWSHMLQPQGTARVSAHCPVGTCTKHVEELCLWMWFWAPGVFASPSLNVLLCRCGPQCLLVFEMPACMHTLHLKALHA